MTAKPPYNPRTAPVAKLAVPCILDSDLGRFASGMTRLATTNNAIGFPLRDIKDPAKVIGRVFFSTNPTAALVVSLDGDKRQWTILLNDVIESVLTADGLYLAKCDPPKKKVKASAKLDKKAKKKGRR